MSLHIATHSLQICTEGPVMIFSTCSAFLPQNEQRIIPYPFPVLAMVPSLSAA
jgi:16S rRNA C967 or C1407 C5-methylase (RsmB/RsmF family)